jgi:hypothetical protein
MRRRGCTPCFWQYRLRARSFLAVKGPVGATLSLSGPSKPVKVRQHNRRGPLLQEKSTPA